ncbi:MAG TPA: cyclase family protein [Vicinamibacterales bacterium]|jgi:arylformamidase|nr:cyclase family protein [Vicinamibacterales bacterium]
MKLIDVSVVLDASLPTYPGNTPFTLEAIKRVARGDSSNVSSVHMSAHAGTHVDAPRHFFDQGIGVDGLPLEILCGRTRVIEVASRKAVEAADLAGADLSEDVRVLIKTHNSRLWGNPAFQADYIGVAESGAKFLVEHGIKVVGVDYLSVEPFKTPGAPTHHVLLGGGTIVIEGLNLRDVEPGIYDMICLPLRIAGADGAPARVVLRHS